MKVIECIAETIDELLEKAEEHIECAHKLKEEYPSVASTYYKTSMDEMADIAAFHDQVTALIEVYKKEKGEPPERMMGKYEYIHEKHINAANKIKILQGLFK